VDGSPVALMRVPQWPQKGSDGGTGREHFGQGCGRSDSRVAGMPDTLPAEPGVSADGAAGGDATATGGLYGCG